MNQQITKYLKEIIQQWFEFWPIKVKEIKVNEDQDTIKISLQTDKDNLFIQPNAEPMLALQHLIRLGVKQKFPEGSPRILLSIGGYHQKQEQKLAELSQSTIKKVLTSKSPIHLPPMSSFERRLVHLYVSQSSEVISESSGVGENRHVVIKLKE
jgi:spoIIIJ-associated protein